MKKKTWKSRIKKACREAGVYQPYFDYVIDSLAGIMEMRDNAQEQFTESGGETVIEYTNKNGSTNQVKNPALAVVMDCNAQAMAYWKELGLTPAGLKKINEKRLEEASRKEPSKTVLELMRAKHTS